MWANVAILGTEDLSERGIRVHVMYSTDDNSENSQSEVDVPLGAAPEFFDAAVQSALDRLNAKDELISALRALPQGAYALGTVTTAVQTAQTNLGLKTGGASNAPAN